MEYELKTLQDVYDKVPKESRENFLKDFGAWLSWKDDCQAQLSKAVEAIGNDLLQGAWKVTCLPQSPETMFWLDDGKPGQVRVDTQCQPATPADPSLGK